MKSAATHNGKSKPQIIEMISIDSYDFDRRITKHLFDYPLTSRSDLLLTRPMNLYRSREYLKEALF